MVKNYFIIPLLLLTFTLNFAYGGGHQEQTPYISEIHYDNCGEGLLCFGSDTAEGVEIIGNPNFNLTGWNIVLYEKRYGKVYKTVSLTGTIPQNGVLWTEITSIENGSFTLLGYTFIFPAGVALVNTNKTPIDVVEFLSYQGEFTAVDGPAIGKTSTGISVFENRYTSSGLSLQKIGEEWIGPITATPGQRNSNEALATINNSTTNECALYPNPVSNDIIYLSFEGPDSKLVEVYSLIGGKKISKNVNSKEPINVANLAQGFYMIRFKNEGKIISKKLLVK